jgi:DNA primase
MRGRIPDSFIDDLLARVDIVDVIERRVPLKKAGREWTARCPFHDERSPSFYVSPVKQFFHCFGCGAHGSAIKFLMDYERLEFLDAVEELAQAVGLKVPRDGGDERPREDRTDLYGILEAAAAWFQRELPNSPAAQAYCRKRGLDADTVLHFRIGWAPAGWDGLLRALGTTPERLALLDQAGLIASGERGKRYDRFRERLMFPILDRRGRVIAFGGRIISGANPAREDQEAGSPARTAQQGDGPKYLNSPETPLFHKGRELFALWQVKQANARLARLLVVEGYMDVIALHQHGLPIAVATLGTSTSADHAELLFRAAPDVYFCFDGDKAGRAAAWRALESVLPRLRDGRQALFLFLPEGEDPDSLVRKEGQAGFEQRLQSAMPLSEYFFEELAHDVNLASLDGRARLAERARPLLAKLPDGAFRDLMRQELTRRTGVQSAAGVNVAAPRTLPRAVAKRSLVRGVIALLLAQPGLAEQAMPPYPFAALNRPGVDLLIELLELARARPGISTASLLEHFAERPEAAALHKLALVEFPADSDKLREEFADALIQLARQTVAVRISELTGRQADTGLSDAEKAELRELLAAKGRR